MTVTVGLMSLPQSWADARRHAELAESSGIATLWTGDHLRHPRDIEQPFLDGWSLLPAWAAVTETVRLGMLVSNIIYRHPALLARQCASTDVISGGRVTLGVGTGVYATDHAMAGVPIWSPAERVARLDETLELLDLLLRGEVVSHEGRHYSVQDAAVRPTPVQTPRPPFVVGALNRRTIDVAVRRADVWNTWCGHHADEDAALEAVRRQTRLVDSALASAGRDPASLRRSICLYPPFDPWRRPEEFERLVDLFLPLGITEFVAYTPQQEDEDRARAAVAAVTRS